MDLSINPEEAFGRAYTPCSFDWNIGAIAGSSLKAEFCLSAAGVPGGNGSRSRLAAVRCWAVYWRLRCYLGRILCELTHAGCLAKWSEDGT